MPTFLIKTDGVESVVAYPHNCDAIIAAVESSPGCRHVSLKVIPYNIGTKLTDLLTGDIFFITDITPTIVSYSGMAGSGKAARCQLESVFKINEG